MKYGNRYSYDVLIKKYEKLQETNKELRKLGDHEIRRHKRTIKELRKRLEEERDLVKYRERQIREKDLIIGELLGRGEKCIYQKKIGGNK